MLRSYPFIYNIKGVICQFITTKTLLSKHSPIFCSSNILSCMVFAFVMGSPLPAAYNKAQRQLDTHMRAAGSVPKVILVWACGHLLGFFLCQAKPACNECGFFKNTHTCCILYIKHTMHE